MGRLGIYIDHLEPAHLEEGGTLLLQLSQSCCPENPSNAHAADHTVFYGKEQRIVAHKTFFCETVPIRKVSTFDFRIVNLPELLPDIPQPFPPVVELQWIIFAKVDNLDFIC